jgi:beta-glucosidase
MMNSADPRETYERFREKFMTRKLSWFGFGLVLLAALVPALRAQTDMAFRNPRLSDDERITDLLSKLTLEEKVSLMGGEPKVPRLGLIFSGQVEGLHGLALGGPGHWEGRGKEPVPTTTFPQERGLGNTWDTGLMAWVGQIEGYEARYAYQNEKIKRGGLIIRAPNVDLARDPRWGRSEESMGEDPFLVGSMAVAFQKGLQGPFKPGHWQAASLMKHFMANENEDTRDSSSSDFKERLFREYYGVPFRMGFEQGGSRAVMAAYNSWNGTPMMINPVLKDVVIKEWGNNGIICTDGGALGLLITAHKTFPTREQGAAAAIKAGINTFLDNYKDDVNKALADGLLTEADIDASLRGLLRVFYDLGEFDEIDGVPPPDDINGKIGRDKNPKAPWDRKLLQLKAREVTVESVVLLKNENDTLPLDASKLKTIAVIGPYADDVLLDWYSGTPPYKISPLQGIKEAAKNANVVFDKGNDPAAAAALAKTTDVAIVVVGNHPYCNATKWKQCDTPSNGREAVDRKTIVLEQEQLVKQVYAANPHTVEVLISSFPYAIVWSQQHVPAIVHMTQNSQELGHGLADVLFGEYSPAGRLVQTWPTGDDQLLPMMDYDITHGRTYMYSKLKPLYAFGYGLSYTKFSYDKISTNVSQIGGKGQVEVTVQVKNTGARDSDEVVQLYVQHMHSKVTRPKMELKGFKRVHIAAGKTEDVVLELKAQDLAYWDEKNHAWEVEKEPIKLLAGGSSDTLPLSAQIEITSAAERKP